MLIGLVPGPTVDSPIFVCIHALDLKSPAHLITGLKGAIPEIVGLLKDEDSGVREAALSAIGEFLKQRKASLSVHVPVLILYL